MATPAPQTVVLTTSSPGVVWFALVAVGIESHRASVVTRPGAAADTEDPGLARDIGAALALTGARQLVVITYKQDIVFQLGDRGLANLARKAGVDPRCWSRHGAAVIPGLEKDSQATALRAVRELARAAWMPPGLAVLGVVVDRDGSHENVALEVVSEPTADAQPASAGGELPPQPADDLEPHPFPSQESTAAPSSSPATAPWPEDDGDLEVEFFKTGELGADDGGEQPQPAPQEVGSSMASAGPVASVATVAQGPLAVAGPDSSGPVGLGGALSSGPVRLGGFVSEGWSALGEIAETGPVGLGGSALDGPSGGVGAVGSGGALSSESGAIPAAGSSPRAAPEGDNLLGRWIAEDGGRTVAEMDVPVGNPESGDINTRLARSAELLHHFLRSRKFQPPIDQDVRELLRQGASPEAIMRHLKILVTQFTGERADVRAAFGTLEMAQTLLTRDDLTALLRRILR